MREFINHTFFRNGYSYNLVIGAIDLNDTGQPMHVRILPPENLQKQLQEMHRQMDEDALKPVALLEDEPKKKPRKKKKKAVDQDYIAD